MGNGIITRRGFGDVVLSTPNVVNNGLILYLDPANTQSYPGSGSTIFDLSPSGFNGTLGNNVTFNSQFDGVLQFPSSPSGYVNLGTALNRPNNSPFTIQMFVNFQGTPTSTQIIFTSNETLNDGGPYRYMFGVYPNFNTMTIYNGNNWAGNKSFNFNLNTWYNMVITYDGSQATFYINNQQVGSSFSFSYSGTSSYNTNIGGYSDTQRFQGLVGTTLYYDRELSLEEIQSNFNAHKDRYGL